MKRRAKFLINVVMPPGALYISERAPAVEVTFIGGNSAVGRVRARTAMWLIWDRIDKRCRQLHFKLFADHSGTDPKLIVRHGSGQRLTTAEQNKISEVIRTACADAGLREATP